MRRREFITLLGGAAASWPLAAHAQKPDRIRRIGVLIGNASSAEDPIAKEILQQFRSAMQEAGWIDGKNIRLDYRFGGDVTTINASAAELVALAPEVIYGTGLPAARALHQKHKRFRSSSHKLPIRSDLVWSRRSGTLAVMSPAYRLGPLNRRQVDTATPGHRARTNPYWYHLQS